ncbi:MAG: rhamnulokinase [Oscillospiraceae bacterium]|nr:rhamnulokinase [Oscillospiraceae bacterium]
MKKVLAFDFGASSGRAVLAYVCGGKLKTEEIHRFKNEPVTVNGGMYWDVLRLFHEIKNGITAALKSGGFDAISVDTWGVDFGLIDKNGELLANPVHYRDRRTEDIPEKVFKIIPKDELFKRTGIQFMRINTLYQLMFLKLKKPYLLDMTDKFLLTPDLFAYFLTGEKKAETSIASTTNLLNPYTRNWDYDLIEKLGLPSRIFPEIAETGSVRGMLSEELCTELGCKSVPVISVAEHDTESAAAAMTVSDKKSVFISSGTWSLFGIETEKPLIGESDAGFTNECGCNNKICHVKNIMGLWLLQETRRQWQREGKDVGFDEMEKTALLAKSFKAFINPDDPSFETAGNIPLRICEYCRKTGQPVPESDGEILRCIYDSLAMKYRQSLMELSGDTGVAYEQLLIFGGGVKDKLLCKLTADACGIPVITGPSEATIIGNVKVALAALGEPCDGVGTESGSNTEYLPDKNNVWSQYDEIYKNILYKAIK